MVIYIQKNKSIIQRLKELWYFRELIYFFAWKDIKIKYKQAMLGALWIILQPVLLMLIFTLVGKAVNIQTGAIPYSVYVFAGIIFWNIFASGVQNIGNSFVSNANILKKIYFPKLIMPFSSLMVVMFDFFISFIVFLILIIWEGVYLNWLKVFVFFWLIIFFITLVTLGLGLFFASFNVRYRDVRYVIPFFIQLMFFASPIIYSPLHFEEAWKNVLYAMNPYVAVMELVHHTFFNMPLHLDYLWYGVVSAVLLFALGVITFFAMEKTFADVV